MDPATATGGPSGAQAYRGQVQFLSGLSKLLFPVVQLVGEYPAGKPLTLPHCIVRILDWEFGKRRFFSA